MTYVSTNRQMFSTVTPIVVFFAEGEKMSGPHQVGSDAIPENILEVSNNSMIGTIGGTLILSDLNNRKYALASALLVTIDQIAEDEFIVSFPEAEISRSGETPKEAMDWLKTSIVKLYQLYKKAPKLGPLPARQLKVLRKYIVEKSHP